MSVTEIIRAVKKLSPSDQAKVVSAITRSSREMRADSVEKRQAELHRRLVEEGLLKRIPDRSLRDRNFKPIKIKGKPLSETIIEDRR